MKGLIENLRAFNSKERFFLVGEILGNPSFKPSADFLGKLGDKLHLNIPPEVFSAMDYHIDWIYAALKVSGNGEEKIFVNKDKLIKAQQQDIDFLIAYDEGNQTHIILIEAKGVTGWTNKQMDSKAERFKAIFGEDGRTWEKATPHFVLMSPKKSEKLNTDKWPEWMKSQDKYKYLKLPICRKKLKKVTRCNIDGKDDKDGGYWTVNSR